MMTLVTGATGFLGRHLVRELVARGEQVRALVRPRCDGQERFDVPVELASGDVTRPDSVVAAMRGVDRVYHAAAQVVIGARADSGMARTNADGTRHVLEAAWWAGVERVVYTSSVGVIGGSTRPRVLSEDDVYTGHGTNLPYMRSKLLADRVACDFVRRGLPVVPVYPTLFFGPGDRYLRTARTVQTYLEGRALAYIAGGFGCADVRDVARGHLLAMARGQVGRRYILGGWNVTLREFYELLERITHIRAPRLRLPASLAYLIAGITKWIEPYRGKPPAITHGDVDSARLYWFYNYARARDELGLVCRPLVETLRDTVDWLLHELPPHRRPKTSVAAPVPV